MASMDSRAFDGRFLDPLDGPAVRAAGGPPHVVAAVVNGVIINAIPYGGGLVRRSPPASTRP